MTAIYCKRRIAAASEAAAGKSIDREREEVSVKILFKEEPH